MAATIRFRLERFLCRVALWLYSTVATLRGRLSPSKHRPYPQEFSPQENAVGTPDFYLVSSENARFTPRACRIITRLHNAVRDDFALVTLDTPLPPGTFRGVERELPQLLLASRHTGFNLFHITKWPVAVYICIHFYWDMPAPDYIGDNFSLEDWGEVYFSQEDAQQVYDYFLNPQPLNYANPWDAGGRADGRIMNVAVEHEDEEYLVITLQFTDPGDNGSLVPWDFVYPASAPHYEVVKAAMLARGIVHVWQTPQPKMIVSKEGHLAERPLGREEPRRPRVRIWRLEKNGQVLVPFDEASAYYERHDVSHLL